MFFSSLHGIISGIDHILVHKTSLNKFKKIKIIFSIISDHSDMKQEINTGGILGNSKYVQLKHTFEQPRGQRRNQKRFLTYLQARCGGSRL